MRQLASVLGTQRLEVTSFLICVYTPDCTDFSGNGLGLHPARARARRHDARYYHNYAGHA